MAVFVASHLKRNRLGIYCFRRVIPKDLRSLLGVSEITRSTRTREPRQAAVIARGWSASVDSTLRRARELAKKNQSSSLSVDLITRFRGNLGILGPVDIEIESKPDELQAHKELLDHLQKGESLPRPDHRTSTGPRLFDEIDKFLDEGARSGNWRDQTTLDIRGDFNQFKAILGDIAVSDLSHEVLNKLRDTLVRLPANINKLPQTKGKAIEEILALGLPPQSIRNVQKKWDRLTTFCDRLVGLGLINQNFAVGKKPRGRSTSHEKFSDSDLRKLFENDFYRQAKYREAFQYWLPHLALFSGARIEELAQLHLSDVRTDEATGITYLNISAEADEGSTEPAKQLKNSASQRRCPVHSRILDAGFLAYVDSLRAAGYGRLFPGWPPQTPPPVATPNSPTQATGRGGL